MAIQQNKGLDIQPGSFSDSANSGLRNEGYDNHSMLSKIDFPSLKGEGPEGPGDIHNIESDVGSPIENGDIAIGYTENGVDNILDEWLELDVGDKIQSNGAAKDLEVDVPDLKLDLEIGEGLAFEQIFRSVPPEEREDDVSDFRGENDIFMQRLDFKHNDENSKLSNPATIDLKQVINPYIVDFRLSKMMKLIFDPGGAWKSYWPEHVCVAYGNGTMIDLFLVEYWLKYAEMIGLIASGSEESGSLLDEEQLIDELWKIALALTEEREVTGLETKVDAVTEPLPSFQGCPSSSESKDVAHFIASTVMFLFDPGGNLYSLKTWGLGDHVSHCWGSLFANMTMNRLTSVAWFLMTSLQWLEVGVVDESELQFKAASDINVQQEVRVKGVEVMDALVKS